MAVDIEKAEAAARCLRDDPSFPRLPIADQRREASALIGSDVLDDIEAVLMLVDCVEPSPHVVQGVRPHVAKLLGDQIEMPVDETPGPVVAAPVAPKPQAAPKRARAASVPRPATIKTKSGEPIVRRYKLASGSSDEMIGHLIHLPRTTVQAYVGGRLPEMLSAEAVGNIREALVHQRAVIDKLLAEL